MKLGHGHAWVSDAGLSLVGIWHLGISALWPKQILNSDQSLSNFHPWQAIIDYLNQTKIYLNTITL